MKVSTKQKQIQTVNRVVVAEEEGWTGTSELADANYFISRWINNKVPLHSIGIYICIL